MKAIVVYYSLSGKTKLIAKTVAGELKAELARIETVEEVRKVDFGKFKVSYLPTIFRLGLSAFLKKKANIKPMDFSLRGYDTVVIGTPVWANNPTPAVNTFVSKADLAGKNVAVFATTMGGGPAGNTLKKLKRKIEGKGGTVTLTEKIEVEKSSGEEIITSAKDFANKLKV